MGILEDALNIKDDEEEATAPTQQGKPQGGLLSEAMSMSDEEILTPQQQGTRRVQPAQPSQGGMEQQDIEKLTRQTTPQIQKRTEAEPSSKRDMVSLALDVVLVGGGAAIGGVAGSAAGGVGAVPGAVEGAFLGGLAKKQAMRIIDDAYGVADYPEGFEQVKAFAVDAGNAATEALLSERLLGPVMSGIKIGTSNVLGFVGIGKSAKRKAGKVVSKVGQKTPDDINVVKRIEERTGVKFTEAQVSNDKMAIALQDSLSHGNVSTAVDERGFIIKTGDTLSREQRESVNIGLRNYYEDVFTKQGQTSDFINLLDSTKKGAEATVGIAEDRVKAEMARLDNGLDQYSMGENVLNRLTPAKAALKKEVDDLYKGIVGKEKVDPTTLNDDLIAWRSAIDPATDKGLIPDKLLSNIFRFTKGAKPEAPVKATTVQQLVARQQQEDAVQAVTIDNLRALREQATDKAFQFSQSKPTLSNRYGEIKQKLDDFIDSLEGNPQSSDRLKEAISKRRELGIKYEEATIGDVLRKGRRGEATNMAVADIARAFWKPGSLKQYIKVMGDDELAVQGMRDYAKFKFLNDTKAHNSTGFSMEKANFWLNNKDNRGMLKELGMLDEFNQILKNQSSLKQAQAGLDIFNKSVAGKVLGMSNKKAVNTILNSSNPQTAVQSFMKIIGDNKEAKLGFQKMIADDFLEQAAKVTKGSDSLIIDFDSFNKINKKFSPILRELYKNEPEKIVALSDIKKGYEVLSRTGRPGSSFQKQTNALVSTLYNMITPWAVDPSAQRISLTRLGDFVFSLDEKRTKSALLRASYDPEYAQVLRQLVKKDTAETRSAFTRIVNQTAVSASNVVEAATGHFLNTNQEADLLGE